MSAPVSHHPLVVNTQDGSCWTRRAVSRDGRGLYALAGSVAGVPDEVLVSLADLAELGITGSAFALPVPIGTEPQAPEHGPLWSLLDWSLWGAGMGDVFREPLADAMLAGVPAETREQAEQIMAAFIERRKIEKTGVTVWQEQRDELASLRARVAELEAEPTTVYRASHDAIVFGLYATAAPGREHCEVLVRREQATAELDWIEDEEDGVVELVAMVDGIEWTTGYVVTALEVASAYDEEADE